MLAYCYLLTSSGNLSSSRQDSQIEENIFGRCTEVELSVHGASNKPYMVVFHVRNLLTHYVYIYIYTKIPERLHKQCIAPLRVDASKLLGRSAQLLLVNVLLATYYLRLDVDTCA